MKTLNEFRALLPTNKHRLDDELEVQADMMERISQRVTQASRNEADLKDELARVEARLSEDVRHADPKATVAAISGKVSRSSERQRAFTDYMNAIDEHAAWKGLLEAWRSKGFNIKTLADLHGANYYSPSSTSARRPRDEDQTAARRAMREAGPKRRRIE